MRAIRSVLHWRQLRVQQLGKRGLAALASPAGTRRATNFSKMFVHVSICQAS